MFSEYTENASQLLQFVVTNKHQLMALAGLMVGVMFVFLATYGLVYVMARRPGRRGRRMQRKTRRELVRELIADGVGDLLDDLYEKGKIDNQEYKEWCRGFSNHLGLKDLVPRKDLMRVKKSVQERLDTGEHKVKPKIPGDPPLQKIQPNLWKAGADKFKRFFFRPSDGEQKAA